MSHLLHVNRLYQFAQHHTIANQSLLWICALCGVFTFFSVSLEEFDIFKYIGWWMCNVHRNLLMANSAETVKSLAAIYIFSKLSAFRIQVELVIDWKCLWAFWRTKVTFEARNQYMIRITFVCSRLFQAELIVFKLESV